MAKITLDTSQLLPSRCQVPGCNSRGPYYRHHKGCDNALGKYNKNIRERYYEYLDCCMVCDNCHMKIHFLYMPILRSWVDRTPEGTMMLRQYLIAFCDRILGGEIKLVKPDILFKIRWKKKLKTWKRRTKQARKRKNR